MTNIDRRKFLTRSSKLFGSATVGLAALQSSCKSRQEMSGRDVRRQIGAALGEGGYGPLEPAGPDLMLPEGFQYRLFGVEGSSMSDGHVIPGGHDGMAAFTMPNGNIRLIRNHELFSRPLPNSAIGEVAAAYDPTAAGGTTSLEIHPETHEVVRDFVSLGGTHVNCAGGPTPWQTWLSCEETTAGKIDGFERDHGYVFEVWADAESQREPVPLRAMGRFKHEAAAVDPVTGIVYLTEDSGSAEGTSGFYRLIPAQPYVNGSGGDLSQGGRLQMLAIRHQPEFDTAKGQTVGQGLSVSWIDIPDPDTAAAESNILAVFEQGWNRGGARFSRLEGCWHGDEHVYFSSTNGGDVEQGQIWRFTPSEGGGELVLLFESPHPDVLDFPDNVCMSPGGTIVICEDGANGNYVRGLTADGKLFDLVLNTYNQREFAGTTFSPDGRTLFVNIQSWGRGGLGKTFAIWGPWERGAV